MSPGWREQKVMDQSMSPDPPVYWTADLDPVSWADVEKIVRQRYRDNGDPLPDDLLEDIVEIIEDEIAADIENGAALDYVEALVLASRWDEEGA